MKLTSKWKSKASPFANVEINFYFLSIKWSAANVLYIYPVKAGHNCDTISAWRIQNFRFDIFSTRICA